MSVGVRPRWSGRLQVRDVLGAGADLTPGAVEGPRDRHPVAHRLATVRAKAHRHGRRRGQPACTARGSRMSASAAGMSVRRTASVPRRAGHTYRFTKVVGFATSDDARAPGEPPRTRRRGRRGPSGAATPSRGRPVAPRRRRARSAGAPAPHPRGDVLPPRERAPGRRREHQPGRALRGWLQRPRLLGRGDVDVPALLALHPDDASTVVDYRFRTATGPSATPRHRVRRHALRLGERPQRRRG